MDFTIVTDSSSNLTDAMIDEFGIQILPLRFMSDGEEYQSYTEGEKSDLQRFFDMMRDGKVFTTSLPYPDKSEEKFRSLLDAGNDVLYLGFSSGLSGTHEAMTLILENLKPEYPDRKINVVDTLCASLGQGLLVWYACQKRDEGMSLEEVTAWCEDNKLNLCHWFTVDDLKYLKRGGRISAATALVGTMLNIKPVLHVDDEGHLISVSKVRGRKASIEALAKQMEELGIPGANDTAFICHGDCLEDAEYLAKIVKERCGVKEVFIGYTGAVIGSHSGPGTLALFFLGEHR